MPKGQKKKLEEWQSLQQQCKMFTQSQMFHRERIGSVSDKTGVHTRIALLSQKFARLCYQDLQKELETEKK